MSKQRKPVDAPARKSPSSEGVDGPAVELRLRPEARPKGPAQKLHDKRADARRKLPFGPLGGSGRKTNVSRSS